MKRKTYNQFQKEVQNQKKKASYPEPNPENQTPLCNCDPIRFRYPY